MDISEQGERNETKRSISLVVLHDIFKASGLDPKVIFQRESNLSIDFSFHDNLKKLKENLEKEGINPKIHKQDFMKYMISLVMDFVVFDPDIASKIENSYQRVSRKKIEMVFLNPSIKKEDNPKFISVYTRRINDIFNFLELGSLKNYVMSSIEWQEYVYTKFLENIKSINKYRKTAKKVTGVPHTTYFFYSETIEFIADFFKIFLESLGMDPVHYAQRFMSDSLEDLSGITSENILHDSFYNIKLFSQFLGVSDNDIFDAFKASSVFDGAKDFKVWKKEKFDKRMEEPFRSMILRLRQSWKELRNYQDLWAEIDQFVGHYKKVVESLVGDEDQIKKSLKNYEDGLTNLLTLVESKDLPASLFKEHGVMRGIWTLVDTFNNTMKNIYDKDTTSDDAYEQAHEILVRKHAPHFTKSAVKANAPAD